MPPRLTLLNDTSTRANWGCRVTSLGLHDLLREAVGADVPLDLVPLVRKRRVDKLAARFHAPRLRRAMANSRPTAADRRHVATAARLLYRAHLPKLHAADAVVFQAEGTMTGLKFTAAERLLLLPHYAKAVLGKPLVALNQTLFSADPAFEPAVVGVLSGADLLAVREPSSLAYARAIGLDGCRLIPDTAFNVVPTEGNPLAAAGDGPRRPYLCVSGTSVADRVGPDAFAEVCAGVVRRFDLDVVVLGSTSEDRRLFGPVAGAAGVADRVTVLPAEVGHREVAAVLRDARAVVTGRYHMAVVAAAVGTPVVLLPSNTFKNEGLTALLDWPLPVREFADTAGVLTDVGRVLADRDALTARLTAVVWRLRRMLSAGGEAVSAIVRGAPREEREAALARLDALTANVTLPTLAPAAWYVERRPAVRRAA